METLKQLPESQHEVLCETGAKSIMLNQLGGQMQLEKNKWLAQKWMKCIINSPTGKKFKKRVLIAGKTQSGKTATKAVMQAVCTELNCPLIIVTKDLFAQVSGHGTLIVDLNPSQPATNSSTARNGGIL